MKSKYTKELCILLLTDKQAAINSDGEARFPKRSDFSDDEVCAIKAFLGPWPRALEAAGLKEPRNDDRIARNREKRERAKQRKMQMLNTAEDNNEKHI